MRIYRSGNLVSCVFLEVCYDDPMMIQAYAAKSAGEKLEEFEYDPGELGRDEVEIDVEYCGVCHSDLSMWKNDWGMSAYPLVPGHEVVGTVSKLGENVKNLKEGQRVGLGWTAGSCMGCPDCMSGDHNLCDDSEGTIVGRHGGFANKVRAQAAWALPIPDGLDASKVGPMMCGGVTVFNPILQSGVKPTDKVGVVGIGGLGHMALQFLKAWGCEVTAFSTTPDKEDEARELGAHHFVNSRDEDALKELAGNFDFILVTVNANLPWDLYVNALGSKGVLHLVGAAEKLEATVFPMIMKQRSIIASPIGSPETQRKMLEFAARHGVEPMVDMFPMDKVNEALEFVEAGQARYRVVLKRSC